ncbi:hypothetical protein [Solimonas variicoloris]|uniref:hypothetical protein n=1 Tax=Solimonas variicoloris TaxID=254408 RepID=UPI0003823337|nr:hypothetical protein [Solimonas variicoloris]
MLKKSKATRMLGGATLALLAAPTAAFAYDIAAATAAAEGAACTDARPFYWEIGGSSGAPIASGQVGGTDFARNTTVTLASASKWVFAAYVLQRYSGIPTGSGGAQIVDALNMKLGYTSLNDYLCQLTLTVSGCFTVGSNDNHDSAADGHFFYNSGHGQYVASQASLLNLGNKTRNTLFTEVNSYLNLGSSFGYANLPLSSGMQGNAADYATFLQRIMTGYYVISSYLNYSPVVTYPCASGLSGCTPLGSVDFHYSLHHWIEDNTGGTLSNGKTLGPGDGAHSSPGAFGFYPWITADKQYYGILSREASSGAPGDSIPCGQAIRKAFLGT